jgi:hypothetical protein
MQRRDVEPHRGGTVLALGIVSLLIPFVGLVTGICAWVMGQGDLRKMTRGEMDVEGRGNTQAGWVCGIIGTVLQTLLVLSCGGCIAFAIIDANRAARTTPSPQRNSPRPTYRRGAERAPRPAEFLPRRAENA